MAQVKRGRPTRARAVRGGSWNNNRNNARCAYRNRNNPDNFNNNLGFRVVLSHDIFPARSAVPLTGGGRGKHRLACPRLAALAAGKYPTGPAPGLGPEPGHPVRRFAKSPHLTSVASARRSTHLEVVQ
ncbi:MAG: SUMF1/EgtB/PvdO family nonheme iron enzyme [Chloroflexota bacterium]